MVPQVSGDHKTPCEIPSLNDCLIVAGWDWHLDIVPDGSQRASASLAIRDLVFFFFFLQLTIFTSNFNNVRCSCFP